MPQERIPILHLDLDAFFAAVEMLERPDLRDKPLIVGSREGRSVVSAANYPARKYGIHSAMTVARALQLYPDVAIVEPDHRKYSAYSRQIMALLGEFTPVVEQLSIDEAFLDISGSYRLFGDAATLAELLRAEIFKRTGLTASVGGAGVKFVAKIASARAKPDGVLLIEPSRTIEFLHPLPVSALWGVGKKSQEVLRGLAIHTIGDVAAAPVSLLLNKLGQAAAHHLHQLSQGIDARPVEPVRVVKSISHEHTFSHDQSDFVVLRRVLLELAEKTAARARAKGLKGRTVALKFRTPDFSTFTRSVTLPSETDVGQRIYRTVLELLEQNFTPGMQLRLIGVKLDNFSEDLLSQGMLWDEDDEWHRADLAIDQLTDRFGSAIVRPASLLGDSAGPRPRLRTHNKSRPDG